MRRVPTPGENGERLSRTGAVSVTREKRLLGNDRAFQHDVHKGPEPMTLATRYMWRTASSTMVAPGQRDDAYASSRVRQALAASTTTQQCPGWMEVLGWRK
ncbi:hypothetical protein EYF80_004899 [Liparis tanakae]|uniref:Uncharacterized protein n=1 Tax=Liparis tanakae TaxID=230148 RepID=A0A4Z2J4N7_9TELE|nr:hypothetical protein EYF80_004899 [Liparis tanakae]